MEELDQIEKWSSVIEQVIRGVPRRKFMKWSTGGLEDCRQIARMAVLEATISPKFAEVLQKDAYLAKRIWSRLVDAARDSALIRTSDRVVASMMRRSHQNGETAEAVKTKKAMCIALIEDMDTVGAPAENSEEELEAPKAERDVNWAISRLPTTIRKVMGHLFGVDGCDKLSVEDTARKLGKEVGTVRRQAYEGRRLLRNLLKDCGYTENGCGSD